MRLATLAFDYLGPLFSGDPTYERYRSSSLASTQWKGSHRLDGPAEILIKETLDSGFNLETKAVPRVTVIIPTFGQFHHTLSCLRSIERHKGSTAFKLKVVDDASDDAYIPLLGLLPGIDFRSNAINLGFLLNCNEAAQNASTEFICFLNNDTEVLPGWLDALVELMDRVPDAGIVGSKLLFADGSLQEAGGIMWRDASAWNWGRGDRPDRPCYNFVRETDYVSGASLLVRTNLWRSLGGFDEHYVPAYCEDSDLAFRARGQGWRVFYQPHSQIIHHEGVSHGRNLESGGKAHQVLNQAKFEQRWRETLRNDHFPNAEHVFLARDRSQSRKHLLIMDHYVPQPDRDAGSRTMMHFMRAFISLQWQIVFWPHNGWYDPHYTPGLQQLGVEVIYGDEAAKGLKSWLGDVSPYIDAVLLSRPDVFEEFEPLVRSVTKVPLMYYGHDIHHRRMQMESGFKPRHGIEADVERMRQREVRIWQASDLVLYPSYEEQHYVSDVLGDDRRSRSIQAYVFEPVAESHVASPSDTLLIFVAGFGHPPNVDAAMWLVKDIMPRVWSVVPKARLKLIGSNPSPDVKNLADEQVEVTGFVTDQQLERYYRSATLALVPLRFGAGVKSKVIEALANGVPLVTTPVGMQGLAESEGVAEVRVEADDFAIAVVRLLKDESRRVNFRLAGLRYAARFSQQSLCLAWSQLLDEFVINPSIQARS